MTNPLDRSASRFTALEPDGFDTDFHCITCSDEAIPATVLSVNSEQGLAMVAMGEETQEVDVSLLDAVAPGDTVLLHGGVALAHAGGE